MIEIEITRCIDKVGVNRKQVSFAAMDFWYNVMCIPSNGKIPKTDSHRCYMYDDVGAYKCSFSQRGRLESQEHTYYIISDAFYDI